MLHSHTAADSTGAVILMYSDYDVYARVYDRASAKYRHVGRQRFIDHMASRIERRGRILDLCCGPGDLVADLRSMGYEADGIDGSAAMVDIAKAKCAEARFAVADARSFTTTDPYDAVLCFGDSLNHVLLREDMLRVFERVFAALRAGATFAFDLNTAVKHERCSGTEVHVFEDLVGIHRASYDGERGLAVSDITVFEKEGSQWRRSDTQLLQTSFPCEDIERLLASAGFADVRAIGIAPSGTTLSEAERILFLARQSASASGKTRA